MLKTGEAIYIDSKMGHAYLAADGCEEALVLGVCSSEDGALVSSLMHMHEPAPELEEVLNGAAPKVRALRPPAV